MADTPPIEEILFDIIDADPCSWDHNHSCQAHGFFYLDQGDLCPQEAAKRWLLENGSSDAKEWLKEHGYG